MGIPDFKGILAEVKAMKSNLIRVILVLILLLTFGSAEVSSQNTYTTENKSIISKMYEPFGLTESLVYEAKWSKVILRGINVGTLNFSVSIDPKSPQHYLFNAEAISTSSLLKLFGRKFYMKIQSKTESDVFRVVQTVKHDEQGERVRDSEAKFDYENNKITFVETDPNNLMRPPRTITSPLENSMHDIVSAIYYLRKLPLTVGKSYDISISDSGVVYNVPVKVASREQQSTNIGKFWTLRIEPEVFGEKGLIQGKGKMIIWVTDDNRHLPVRAQIQSEMGKVEIKIRKANGIVKQ
jgi:hypothetical protein